MEPSIKWAGNPNVTVAVKAFGLKATVQVLHFSICSTFWLYFHPTECQRKVNFKKDNVNKSHNLIVWVDISGCGLAGFCSSTYYSEASGSKLSMFCQYLCVPHGKGWLCIWDFFLGVDIRVGRKEINKGHFLCGEKRNKPRDLYSKAIMSCFLVWSCGYFVGMSSTLITREHIRWYNHLWNYPHFSCKTKSSCFTPRMLVRKNDLSIFFHSSHHYGLISYMF